VSAVPGATRVSAVVVAMADSPALAAALASLVAQAHRPLELVLFGNGAPLPAPEWVREHGVTLVTGSSERNLGVAGGRNAASALATGDALLFLDDDAVVDERLAGELVAIMRDDPGVGLATPKAYRFGTRDVIASAGGMQVRLGRGSITDIGAGARDVGQFEKSGTVESCVGFTVLARWEALERCQGFDERYNPYGWEEVDLSLRIREAGYTIKYAPTAVCWHAGGTPGRGRRLARYERGKIVNYLRLMRRHATAGEWLTFLAIMPLRAAQVMSAQVKGIVRQTRGHRT